MDEKKAAVELLELARKHLEEYGVMGAIQHVYLLASDRGVPWATEDAWRLADNAVDQVIIARGGNAIPHEAAQREGPALLDDAIRHLMRCERCEEPGKPISITDNLGDLGKVTVYLCDRCEGLRRANDPTFMRWFSERLSSPVGGQKE
jgi:hypothetical protein